MREIYKEKKYIGEKMREKWVDILKGMGIIFVCLGHLSPGIFTETHIYSFHMPLFFFISGYLFCRKEHNETFDFIKVKMLINSCGVLMENEKMFHIDEWTLVKKFGYFLG